MLLKLLSLAIFLVLMLVLSKQAGDRFPALDSHQIVDITDDDDRLSEELESTDMIDTYDDFDISGPAWELDGQSTPSDAIAAPALAQQATRHNRTQR